MEELISIIVPVYNVEKYLNKCIDSIINQTYRNLEIILVDDGSPDNCGKICDEYAKKDKRIKVIHKKNGGVSSARNKGIENASGYWISFVDADDWIEKDYIKILVNNKEDADIVLCGYNRVNKNKIEKVNGNGEKLIYNSKEYLIKTLNPQTGIGFINMKLIKKKCIERIRFDENLKVGEDAFFNIQISPNIKKAVFIKKAVYNYRINNDSVVKKYDENYADKYLYSMQTIKKYIFKNYEKEEIRQNYYNFVAFHVLLVAVNYCYNKENKTKNKIKKLQEICNYTEFKEGIQKSNYDNLSLTRKITLFTVKHQVFLLTSLICIIRQLQNKK